MENKRSSAVKHEFYVFEQ